VNINLNTCTREELIEAYKEQGWKIEQLTHELNKLKRQIFGVKSERFISDTPQEQLRISFSQEEHAVPVPEQREELTYQRKKPGKKQHPVRQELPAHLPRKIIDIYPEGYDESMKTLGIETTEVLEYTPGKLHVIRYQRHKCKTNDDQGNARMLIAELPCRAIDKGMAGPGLLSFVITDKYLDHTPLHRQSQQFAREQVNLSRSTLTGWVGQCFRLLLPLYESLRVIIRESSYLQVDESGILVLTQDKEQSKVKGCMQIYHAVNEKLAFFQYTPTKEQANLIEILKSFKGNLQVDGNVSYEELKKEENQKKKYPDITVSHCMAHARRKFDEALDNDRSRASYALTEIQALYEIERRARDELLDANLIVALRKKEAVPILKRLYEWLEREYDNVLPKSKIREAIAYSLKRWAGLCEYVNAGHLLIDNNQVENLIRPLALGRKNYMFAGSHDGARGAALYYSFIGTCKLNNIDAYWWFHDVFIRIQDHPINRIHELLPTKNFRFLHREDGT